jgi:hypothetical protein
MAMLYITELESLATPEVGGNAQIAQMPPVAEQTLAIGASSVASSPFNKRTKYVRLETDSICAIAFGPATPGPTAAVASGTSATATGTARMAANTVEYFGVVAGYEVAVIATS